MAEQICIHSRQSKIETLLHNYLRKNDVFVLRRSIDDDRNFMAISMLM